MHRRSFVLAIGAVLLSSCAQGTLPDPDVLGEQQVGVRTAFGDPLPGLTADELALFEAGKAVFQETETVENGLGPVFNEASCVACHLGPAVGGSTGRFETRFGRRNDSGAFDPLAAEGGSLLQDHAIGAVPGFTFLPEMVPAAANVVAKRRTTPLFGLGLVDATPDAELRALAALQARLASRARWPSSRISSAESRGSESSGGRTRTRRCCSSRLTRISTRWASPARSSPTRAAHRAGASSLSTTLVRTSMT